jgi:DNA-binding transcriptional regulator YiaG
VSPSVFNSLESLFAKEGPSAESVQRNAAGSLRVSLKSPLLLAPKSGGPKGVDVDAVNSYLLPFNLMKDKKRREWDSGRVRALREHMALTQQEMADQLGTRQQTISEWETGMYQPRGASSTLLTIVAERTGFAYGAGEPEKKRHK